jgi:hypothetical protein
LNFKPFWHPALDAHHFTAIVLQVIAMSNTADISTLRINGQRLWDSLMELDQIGATTWSPAGHARRA